MYTELTKSVPGIEERFLTADEEQVLYMAEQASIILFIYSHLLMNPQLRKGVSGGRGDDTRSLKGAVLDWITPMGQTLNPPLSRNKKDDRGFNHERTGALLCPIDLDWSNGE